MNREPEGARAPSLKPTPAAPRTARVERRTRETQITLTLRLDGDGHADIQTGLGFLDHMLATLARFSGWDVELRCTGDLAVEDHHTVEDCAVVLGEALAGALGDRSGLARFGWAYAPMDEALARVALDLVRRPVAEVRLDLRREMLGAVSCENLPHFFRSLAMAAPFTLHVDVLRGENDHHKAEAAFKALALALRQAVTPTSDAAPLSTKGTL